MPVEYQRLVTVVGNTPIGGRVVLVEGFEDGMTWLAAGDGDTWVVDRVTSRSFEGAFSMEVSTRDPSILPITGESVGTGDGSTKTFTLANPPVRYHSETVYIDGSAQTRDEDYTINYDTGEITFTSPPASGASITADYTHTLAQAGDVAYVGRYVHLGSSRKLIFDTRFSFEAEYIDSTLTQVIDTIRFQIAWDDLDSGVLWAAIFDYFPPEGTWGLWHSGGFLSLPELHTLKDIAWHRIRAEIDFENHKYSWLQVDDVPVQQVDLSQYTLYSFSSGGTEYACVIFYVYSELTGYRGTCYFDDVLLLEA